METFLENYKSSSRISTNILDDLIRLKEQYKIEEFILCLMKVDIKIACEDNFEQFSNMNYDDVDNELRTHKELVKLTFDLWKDFSYFSQFSFKSKYDSNSYTRGLQRLHYRYNNGQWTSTGRVVTNQLFEEIIHKYILCYSVWNQKRRMLSSQYCSFCDAHLNYSSFCKYCQSSINDMNFDPINLDHNELIECCNDVEDFWICKICRTNNNFEDTICTKCKNQLPHFGKWSCDRCHYINGPCDFVCSVCYETNIYLKPCVSCQLIQINSQLDVICHCCKSKCVGNWICEDPANHKIYGTLSMECLKCKILPIKPPDKNEVSSFINDITGSRIEKWKCTFCKEFMEIKNDHCYYCLNLRFCDNRVLCFYCGIVNESYYKFCSKCRKNLSVNMKTKFCRVS